MNDIFTENKSLIKRLYQEERKTLKQVKEILEREYQFPQLPLSIYESRLRDLLRMRKKFKKEDWPAIYQYHLKRKRKKKSTALYLDGVKYPWHKAWKEIRRSGAREKSIGQDAPLPPGVELRTPSPSLPASHPSSVHTSRDILPSSPLHFMPSGTNQMSLLHTSERNTEFEKLDSVNVVGSVSIAQSRYTGANINTTEAVASWGDSFSQSGFHHRPLHEENLVSVRRKEVSASGHSQRATSHANVDLSPHIKVMLEYLPWQNCRLQLYSMMTGKTLQQEFEIIDGFTYSLIPRDNFCVVNSGHRLTRMCDTAFPSTWHLHQAVPQLILSPTKFEVYHFLAQAIYLLSNKLLYHWDIAAAELINALFVHLPRETTYSLFQRELPSIQSAWECLLEMAISLLSDQGKNYQQNLQYRKLVGMVHFLINIGLQHPRWLTSHKDRMALAAISISNSDLLRQLLDKGACPRHTFNRNHAISKAITADSMPCVKILIEGCDLNFEVEDLQSHFTIFLEDMSQALTSTGSIIGRQAFSTLDILLEAGADVDSPYPPSKEYLQLLEQTQAPKEWYPTCLDWSFQVDRKLFDRLLPQSLSNGRTITRHGVLLAAMQGRSAFSEYVKSVNSLVAATAEQFLDLIMREQFLRKYPWEFFNIQVLKSLMNIGVQINRSDYHECFAQVLRHATGGIEDGIIGVLDHLIRNGATIDPEVFESAVSKKGTHLLKLLAKYGVEVGKIGGPALVRAAQFGNYDAVHWLLDAGVDIKGGTTSSSGSQRGASLTIIARFISERVLRPSIENNILMLEHLVDCGAELKNLVSDQHAGGLLQLILDEDEEIAPTLITWLFGQLGVGSRKIPKAELQALLAAAAVGERRMPGFQREESHWLLVFNRLYTSYGPPPRPEAILAPLIVNGARDELIQELIRNSANVNTYGEHGRCGEHYTPLQAAASVCNYNLVLQLLNLGADVNAPPRGIYDVTALQAICAWNATSSEERQRQHGIVSLLINHGANINAAPAEYGHTAIIASAMQGDLELAAVLLAYGADPNNCCRDRFTLASVTALDVAVDGRCDMTNILLNTGALSAQRGSTGYEGAILRAERRGHHAVARIIRDHIAQQEEQFRENLKLWACHNAVIKKMDDEDALNRKKNLLDDDSEVTLQYFEYESDGVSAIDLDSLKGFESAAQA